MVPYWDYNGERQENGAGLLHFHIGKDGRRCNAAVAFLDPIRGRPNLTLKTGAEVTRLLIEGKRAVGVEYQQDGQTHQVRRGPRGDRQCWSSAVAQAADVVRHRARRAVAQARHPVVVDLPGVGQNLQDHVQVPFVFRTKTARPNPQLLTGNILFVNTRTRTPEAPPDMQLLFTPAVPMPLSPVLNFGGPACIFLAILVQPESVGDGRPALGQPARSADHQSELPAGPSDVETFLETLKLVRQIAGTKAFHRPQQRRACPGQRRPGSRSSAHRLRHSGTPPAPAKWAATPMPWSIRSCGSTASRACVSSTPR